MSELTATNALDADREMNHKTREENTVRYGFRYFGEVAKGERHPVTINMIKQYGGITDIVSALPDIPQGDVWPIEKIAKRKIDIEFNVTLDEPSDFESRTQAERDQWYKDQYVRLIKEGTPTGLRWDTVESLSFTEAIKSCDVNNPEDCKLRDEHIENFKESVRNLAVFGIHNIIGNFMPVADWTRTGYETMPDGSQTLVYDHAAFTAFDVHLLKRNKNRQDYIDEGAYTEAELKAGDDYWDAHLKNDPERRTELEMMIVAGLPGCQGIVPSHKLRAMPVEQREQEIEAKLLPAFRAQVEKYRDKETGKPWPKERLQDNIAIFLDAVVPEAKARGVRLCAHPDDPAFTPFMGTPRCVGTLEDYKFLLDHGCGANLCTGSLMANPENRKDIIGFIEGLVEHGKKLGMKIEEIFPHVHLRPVETHGKDFSEGQHRAHSDMLGKIIATLNYYDWKGVFRPDHASTPTFEMAFNHGKPIGDRGYNGVGRALGGQQLDGIFTGQENHFDRNLIRKEYYDGPLQTLLDEQAVEDVRKVRWQQYKDKVAHIRDNAVPIAIDKFGAPSDRALADPSAVAQHELGRQVGK